MGNIFCTFQSYGSALETVVKISKRSTLFVKASTLHAPTKLVNDGAVYDAR